MRLIELKITNFGVFQGTNKFDLEPALGPIILFGGKNGSGKTTLLDSIRLCLYGARALSNKTNKKDYDEYIASKIHQQRNAVDRIKNASIVIRFEYAQFGNKNEYEITRSWIVRKSSISEYLLVKKDNIHMKEMAQEGWQDFVDDLIPPGISGLFFFDGEKIQSLATDNLDDHILGEEIKKLLGINIIERLQTDLDVYLYRQRKGGIPNDLSTKVDSALHDKNDAEKEYQAAKQDRSQTESSLDFVRGQIEKIEKSISIESGGFGIARNSIKDELVHIDALIVQTERAIHDLSANLLPFAFVPDLCMRLKQQLQSEAEYQQWLASQNIVRPRISQIHDRIETHEIWDSVDFKIPHEVKTKITTEFSKLLEGVLTIPENISNTQMRHQLSETERIKLLGWIDYAVDEAPKQLKYLTIQLENAEQKKLELKNSLNKVPEDSVLKPFIEELNQHYQRLGELETIASQQDKKLMALNSRLQEGRKQLQKAYDDLRSGESLEDRLKLVDKVHGILGNFLIKLTEEKIDQLEDLVVARFNELIRKPDLVQRVSINPDDFSISLFNDVGESISKGSLSAGEKQMFAIAVLWALRQLSGRPFPVVIDTPLGRLDSEHRNNLIEGYFPRVSHQVIIFSTDTEVDQNYFKLLEPYISHSYHLVFNSQTGSTDIQSGYFWD